MTLSDASFALRTQFPWAPVWSISLVLVACVLAAALLAYEGLVRLFRKGGRRSKGRFWATLLVRTRGPGRLALIIFALSWATDALPLTVGEAGALRHALLAAFIVLCGWTVLTALDIASALYMRGYKADVADNLAARKHLTQVRILQRAAAILVIIVTAGMALMTVPGVRQIGVSLLAAGGAAGIIVGLALQPVLSNLMAGFQIALAQPIRIGDAVVVEGQFGHVEEITSTYVVIRLWDLRRLVVPLRTFLEKPFENWTRESSELIGAVILLVDYRTPIAGLRGRLEEIVRASPLWNGRKVALQVTDARERTLEIRCLVSADDATRLGDLRNHVREEMVTWLQAAWPDTLPRNGVEFGPAEGGTAA